MGGRGSGTNAERLARRERILAQLKAGKSQVDIAKQENVTRAAISALWRHQHPKTKRYTSLSRPNTTGRDLNTASPVPFTVLVRSGSINWTGKAVSFNDAAAQAISAAPKPCYMGEVISVRAANPHKKTGWDTAYYALTEFYLDNFTFTNGPRKHSWVVTSELAAKA